MSRVGLVALQKVPLAQPSLNASSSVLNCTIRLALQFLKSTLSLGLGKKKMLVQRIWYWIN